MHAYIHTYIHTYTHIYIYFLHVYIHSISHITWGYRYIIPLHPLDLHQNSKAQAPRWLLPPSWPPACWASPEPWRSPGCGSRSRCWRPKPWSPPWSMVTMVWPENILVVPYKPQNSWLLQVDSQIAHDESELVLTHPHNYGCGSTFKPQKGPQMA